MEETCSGIHILIYLLGTTPAPSFTSTCSKRVRRSCGRLRDVSFAKVQGIQPKQPQASKVAYVPSAPDEKPSSKSAQRNKKRREAAARAKAAAAAGGGAGEQVQSQTQASASAGAAPSAGPPSSDNVKALRKLKQKLKQIQELKQKQKEGMPLQLNQLEKLKSEQEVLNKIQELKLESSKAASSTFST